MAVEAVSGTAEAVETSSPSPSPSPSPSFGLEARTRFCGLCLTRPAQYTCPRCSARYCGLECYRSPAHEHCAEGFYEQEVRRALTEQRVDQAERRRMLDILQRLRDTDPENALLGPGGLPDVLDAFEPVTGDSLDDGGGDEDAAVDAGVDEEAARLTQVLSLLDAQPNADVADLLAHLSPDQQSAFAQLMRDQQLGADVALWTPWWHRADPEPRLIEVLDSNQDNVEASPAEAPSSDPADALQHYSSLLASLDRPLVTLAELLGPRAGPNPTVGASVPYDMILQLLRYCYALRLYNGETHDSLLPLVGALLQGNDVLTAREQCGELSAAVAHFVLACTTRPSLQSAPEQVVLALDDARAVLQSGHRVQACLVHCLNLLQLALALSKTTWQAHGEALAGVQRKHARQAQHKLYFYACWWQACLDKPQLAEKEAPTSARLQPTGGDGLAMSLEIWRADLARLAATRRRDLGLKELSEDHFELADEEVPVQSLGAGLTRTLRVVDEANKSVPSPFRATAASDKRRPLVQEL
ncbi:uncharacterized protein MONBRDRAFT_28183 [Monosiga brevicollis MX1]|uniref:HIT-type domain-containing protein n=1 Tax=Monosiga brevicollis TaxID=81824 RepID=A9V7F7_MONBE|nr:uncharacterized protein MONBRDRAFT_28183 [Monosiga brevicollis MX1]EDQ86578.1 predicted protein [Monosiga brevicollis MX1]|eukprot:XP_001748691.1 hypothetical protein [Monosiga brevicollis MX1]